MGKDVNRLMVNFAGYKLLASVYLRCGSHPQIHVPQRQSRSRVGCANIANYDGTPNRGLRADSRYSFRGLPAARAQLEISYCRYPARLNFSQANSYISAARSGSGSGIRPRFAQVYIGVPCSRVRAYNEKCSGARFNAWFSDPFPNLYGLLR